MKTLKSYVKQGGFFKAVVEDGSDIIFIVDYSGIILYHNPSVKETLGYRANTLVGKNFFDFILPSSLSVFLKRPTRRAQGENLMSPLSFNFFVKISPTNTWSLIRSIYFKRKK